MQRLHKHFGGRPAAEQGSGSGGESPQPVLVDDPERFTGMLPSLIELAEGVKEGHVGRDETITHRGDAAVEIRDSGDQIAQLGIRDVPEARVEGLAVGLFQRTLVPGRQCEFPMGGEVVSTLCRRDRRTMRRNLRRFSMPLESFDRFKPDQAQGGGSETESDVVGVKGAEVE